MNYEELTLAHTFTHGIMPWLAASIGGCIAWYGISRWVLRTAEKQYRDALCLPPDHDSLDKGSQIRALAEKRSIAARGSPADRLFFSGLMLVASVALVVLCARAAGVTPASKSEREFLAMLGESGFSNDPRVQLALAKAREGFYVSRRTFSDAERAYWNAVKSAK